MADWSDDAIRGVRVGWAGRPEAESVVIVELCDEVLRLRAGSPSRDSAPLLDDLIEKAESHGIMLERFEYKPTPVSDATDAAVKSARAALESRLSTLERDAARMWEAAYKAGFVDGAAGSPNGHPSDFGDTGIDSLTAFADFYATRRAALAPSGEPTTTPATAPSPTPETET